MCNKSINANYAMFAQCSTDMLVSIRSIVLSINIVASPLLKKLLCMIDALRLFRDELRFCSMFILFSTKHANISDYHNMREWSGILLHLSR